MIGKRSNGKAVKITMILGQTQILLKKAKSTEQAPLQIAASLILDACELMYFNRPQRCGF